MEGNPVILFITDASALVRPLLADFEECAQVIVRAPSDTAARTLEGISQCAGLVVELASLDQPPLQWLSHVRDAHPRLPVLAATATADSALIRDCSRLGIEVMVLPGSGTESRAFVQVAARTRSLVSDRSGQASCPQGGH